MFPIKGKGVGVSTLSSLQNVDLILHVLREFEDENVTHYRAKVDPLRDMEIVNKEILYYVSKLRLLYWYRLWICYACWCMIDLQCLSCGLSRSQILTLCFSIINKLY